MVDKRIFIIVFLLNFLLMCSCSKSVYVPEAPQKATYERIQYFSKHIIPIDPSDTLTIKGKSLTEIFTVVDIKKEKGVYIVIVESDSIRTLYNPMTKEDYSYRLSYQIVSTKTKDLKGNKKIEKEHRYKLTLNPCFEPSPNIVGGTYIVYVFTNGMRIPIRKSTLDIYTTPNLDGLYYIEP